MSNEGRGRDDTGACMKRNPRGTQPIITLLWWAPVCIVKEAATVKIGVVCVCVCVRSCEDEACWR